MLPAAAAPPSFESPAAPEENDPFADPVPAKPSVLPPETPDGTLFALVFAAATGSAEPGRRPTAYGLEESALRAEQPQIFDLLATEFSALHIGYLEQGTLRLHLPPRPPRLHAFVHECSPAEVVALTEFPDFVRPLLHIPGEADPNELLAACIREALAVRNGDFDFLVLVGKQLATLLRDDPARLTALLHKLEPQNRPI